MRRRVVSLDALDELDHARGEDAVAERFTEVQVRPVVRAEVDDHGAGASRRGKRVAVVSVVGAVPCVQLRHQRAGVRLS